MISRVINYSGRSIFIQLLFILGFIFLVLRLFYIQIFQDDFIERQTDSRTTLVDVLAARRGEILDRNGKVLAIDTTGYTIVLDLKLFDPGDAKLELLASILNMDKDELLKKVSRKTGHRELIRHIELDKKEEIDHLAIDGVFFKQNLKRSYPQMEISSHVVGVTDIDRKGVQGAELVFEKMLRGKDGSFSGIKSRTGVIRGNRNVAVDGTDLKLTIDVRLQSIAYHELKRAAEITGAKSGSVILVNPSTAHILALTNYPTFNPSDRSKIKDLSVFRNRATVDVFEPGSVIKPIAMAAILESRKIKKDQRITTSPGWIKLGGYKTRDLRDYGILGLSEIISLSSNVGMVKLCIDQDPDHLQRYYSKFGLGKIPTNILIPSREGYVPQNLAISQRDKVSICYGYGLSMTAIQIAQAYQVLANKGVFKELNLFYDDRIANLKPKKRVISEETSSSILGMLIQTVNSKRATGKKARIQGVQVAGKTGTAEKIYNERKSYTATFSGFAPAEEPKLLGVIVLHDLTGESHSGGSAAAPVFSSIIEQSLHVLDSGTL